MEAEWVSPSPPEKYQPITVTTAHGLEPHHARAVAKALALSCDLAKRAAKILEGLYRTFLATDASQIEINQPAICPTAEGDKLYVLDAKVGFDSHAMFLHKDLADMRVHTEEGTDEVEADQHDLHYSKLDGKVVCRVNGTDLANIAREKGNERGGPD